MRSSAEAAGFELICVVVNFGQGSKVIKTAKQCQIPGATVFLGNGTVNNKILEFLAISDIRKEIVIMVSDRETADNALDLLDREFKFEKPNHGIAFTTPVLGISGASNYKYEGINEGRGVEKPMYHAINVIVDRGNAEYVIEAATRAGSKGGTIINARGSGIHETSKVFSMDIEPEKEIVIILSEAEKTGAIVASISEQLKIDEPGNGIIFVQDINKVLGLY